MPAFLWVGLGFPNDLPNLEAPMWVGGFAWLGIPWAPGWKLNSQADPWPLTTLMGELDSLVSRRPPGLGATGRAW